MNTSKLFTLLALTTQLLLACEGSAPRPTPGEPATCTFENNSMPNPASDYCIKSGHTLTNEGVCKFADGNECEQWAFFRGECGLDRSFCATQGYTPKADSGEVTCVFDDGSSCNDWDYSRDCCSPKQ